MKKTHPKTPLALICRKGLGSAFKTLELVDLVFEVEKGDRASYKKILQNLNDYDIQKWVSPHSSVRTALFTWQVQAPQKIAFKKFWNGLFFSERIDRQASWPESLRLLQLWKNESSQLSQHLQGLLEPIHFIKKQADQTLSSPPLWADAAEFLNLGTVEILKRDLKIFERFPFQKSVVFFPGSVWATKMWKKEKFIKLGQELAQKGEKILIMGGPDEKALGQDVAAAIPQAVNLCGQSSLIESLLILSNQKLIVGNDSSSSHMGALMNVPVVSFFGPTVLRFGYRPWGKKTRVFENENLKCRPCGAHGPKKCPLGHHKCMQDLDLSVTQIQDWL